MWKRKIKIGFIDIDTHINGFKNKTHTYKVKIVDDLGDKYQISFGEMVNGVGLINGLNNCTIFSKEKIYGIKEIELNWFERNFYDEWSFGRLR